MTRMRRREVTYSLSSSALDRLSRVRRWSSNSSMTVDELLADMEAEDSMAEAADTICSFTPPQPSMGRARAQSASSVGQQLGLLRWRVKQAVRRRRGRTGDYRLPRSLRPSSMFHLRLRYQLAAIAENGQQHSSGNHNKLMHPDGPQLKVLTPPQTTPHNSGRVRFPFSPSLSSLAVSTSAHYFRFASHLSHMLSPQQRAVAAHSADEQPQTSERRNTNGTTVSGLVGCRCANTSTCLHCYFRSNVVPRRGQFVHTQAGPVLDLAQCPVGAALESSWPSLSTSRGSSSTERSATNRAKSRDGLEPTASDSGESAASLALMQIRLSQRPPASAPAQRSSGGGSPVSYGPHINSRSLGSSSLGSMPRPRLEAAVSLISSLGLQLPDGVVVGSSLCKPPPSPKSCSSLATSAVERTGAATQSAHQHTFHGTQTSTDLPSTQLSSQQTYQLSARWRDFPHIQTAGADSVLLPDSALPPSPLPTTAAADQQPPAYLRLAESARVPKNTNTTNHLRLAESGGDFRSRSTSNHLLLSGVSTDFEPERIFNHRPATAPGRSSGDTHTNTMTRQRSDTTTAPFSLGKPPVRRWRSPSGVPPPLALNSIARTATAEETLTDAECPGSAQSDATSFCTALSSLSSPQQHPSDSTQQAISLAEEPQDDTTTTVDTQRYRIKQMILELNANASSSELESSDADYAQQTQSDDQQIPYDTHEEPSHLQDVSSQSQENLPRSQDISPFLQMISPHSQKSVSVVEQARRARHPVYRFGALANETFEAGKHQDAYDLYSWALELLSPPSGTTAAEMLLRADVSRQLARLGWKPSPRPRSSRRGNAPFAMFSPNTRRAGAVSAPHSPAANTGIGSRPRSSAEHLYFNNRAVTSGYSADKEEAKDEETADAQQSTGRRAWRSIATRWRIRPGSRGSGNTPQTVVVNEPLPEELAQTPSGKYEFSAELLRQLPAQRSTEAGTETAPDAPLEVPSDPRPETRGEIPSDSWTEARADSEVSDSWDMVDGDEKAEIRALLFSNRSAAAYALGRYAAAASDAAQSVAERDEWAKGHFRRGEALLALGRVREAHGAYRRAAALEPQDMHVRISCERARIMAHNEKMGLRVVQLLAGRDFARRPRGVHPIRTRIFEFAACMQNYVYAIADVDSRKCVIVDACWDVDGILEALRREGLLLAAAAITHGHFDHTGGVPPPPFSSLRIRVSGVAELKRRMPYLPLLVHPLDIPDVIASNPQLEQRHFTPTPNGFAFTLGTSTEITFLHTPGHTPGSQCLLVNECRLFSGDTLFPGACGRIDLKGGSIPDMVESLQLRLRAIPDSTVVYPGHEYGGEWTTIGREKKRGFLRHAGEGSAHEKWKRLDSRRCLGSHSSVGHSLKDHSSADDPSSW